LLANVLAKGGGVPLSEVDLAWLVPYALQSAQTSSALMTLIAGMPSDSPHLPSLCQHAANIVTDVMDRSVLHERWLDYLVSVKRTAEAFVLLERLFRAQEPFLQRNEGRKFFHFFLLYLSSQIPTPQQLQLGLSAGADARRRWPDYNIRHNYGILALANGLWPLASTLLLESARFNIGKWPTVRRPAQCNEWEIIEWSNRSNISLSEGPSIVPSASPPPTSSSQALFRLDIILPAGRDLFGEQLLPHTVTQPAALAGDMPWLCTAPDCTLFSMVHPEQDVVAATLRDAWVEGVPGARDVVVVHAGCTFHLVSKQHTRGITAPTVTALVTKPVVAVQRAALLHWNTRNYYHFVAEVLPKLLLLRDAGALAGSSQRTPGGAGDAHAASAASPYRDLQVLLVHQSWVEEYVSLLGVSAAAVYIEPGRESYRVQHLAVLDFVLPAGGVPPDRLSTSPSTLLLRLREVSARLSASAVAGSCGGSRLLVVAAAACWL